MNGALIERLRLQGLKLVAIPVLLVGWELLSWRYPPDILPGVIDLAQRVWAIVADPKGWLILGSTLGRILQGVVFCMLIGVPTGVAMGVWSRVEGVLRGWVVVLLAMPAIVWAFLSVLWFGIGEIAPVFTIILVVVPIVILNVWQGVKATDKDLYQMGRAFNASFALIFRKILIPHLLPYISSSVKIAFSLGWKIALIGEVFGVSVGVGREFMTSFQQFQIDMMLAWAVTFMTLMAAVEVLVFRNLDKIAYGWRRPQIDLRRRAISG